MFDQRFKEMLGQHDFEGTLDTNWFEQARKAMRRASPISMGVSGEEFKQLYHTADVQRVPINCWQFALLNNNLEARSAFDLGLDQEVYNDLMVETSDLSAVWSSQTNPVRDKLLDTIHDEQKQAFKPKT